MAGNEQANSEKGMANFRTRRLGPGLEHAAQVPVVCFTEIPKPSSSHFLAVLQISTVQKLYLECRFSMALKRALSGIYVFSKQSPKVFWATVVELVTVDAL